MNDINNIEAIRDTLTDQIYEHVFPYMREHNMFNENDLFLNRVRNFLERADNLPSLYMNNQINDLNNEIDNLNKELNELLIVVKYKNVN
ncbi:MAG: hypothetical protein LUG12_09200 [Erysipelotrichaceae bacterium]|nr:hypothetical protein [Erysipelotrichaceae bacterium]